jgi:hypothetical protein
VGDGSESLIAGSRASNRTSSAVLNHDDEEVARIGGGGGITDGAEMVAAGDSCSSILFNGIAAEASMDVCRRVKFGRCRCSCRAMGVRTKRGLEADGDPGFIFPLQLKANRWLDILTDSEGNGMLSI